MTLKMIKYRYHFDKSSKKFRCPICQRKTFVLYVDSVSGDYLPEQFGKCDRESNCGHYQKPPQAEKGNFTKYSFQPKQTQSKKPEQIHIPKEVLEQTLNPERYESNVFLQNLLSRVPFPVEALDLEKVISLYCLGTVIKGERKGAITFPFIDRFGNIRAIQAKQFDKENHTLSTDWIHSIISREAFTKPDWIEAYQKQENKVSCLFGEHLLSVYPNNPIALVEAPKTAVYGTLYFGLPETEKDWVWLAVFNASGFNKERCKALKGRSIILFPDLSKSGNVFDLWNTRAKEMNSTWKSTIFIVSDLLEKNATDTERMKGLDLADYLIQHDWRLFRNKVP